MIRITPHLLQYFGIGFASGAILFTALVQFAFGRNRRARDIAAARAFALRTGPGGRTYPRVRQTDIPSRLTRVERSLFHQAERLESQQQYLEAAELFERIRFQRRAIDILERAGLVNEAAQVLLRLKAPHRAAVIFERNGRLEQAARYFQVAGLYREAGSAFVKLAVMNGEFWSQAADCFIKSKDFDLALDAYAQILRHDDVLRISMMNGRFGFLAGYLRHRGNAQLLLPFVSDGQLQTLLDALPQTPMMIQTFAGWVDILETPDRVLMVISAVSKNRDFSLSFWQQVPADVRQKVIELIERSSLAQMPALQTFCEHLESRGFFRDAARLYARNQDWIRSAQCFLRLAMLDHCHAVLKTGGILSASKAIEEILETNQSGPWEPLQLERAEQVLAKVVREMASADAKDSTRQRQTERAVQEFMDARRGNSGIANQLSAVAGGKKSA